MRAVTLTLHPSVDRILELENLRLGEVCDARLLLTVPAGKGVNTARSLSHLIKPAAGIVAALWAGADQKIYFEQNLYALNGIRAECFTRKTATRFSSTLLEKSGRETHLKEAMSAPDSVEEAALLRLWKKTVDKGDIVAVCGSAPSGTSEDTAWEIFGIARRRKARAVIADTNGVLMRVASAANLDGIKGNAAEIGALLKLDSALKISKKKHRKALLRHMEIQGSAADIMVTMGAAGAIMCDGEKIYLAAPPGNLFTLAADLIRKNSTRAPQYRSATGCGDAATAGWVCALHRGLSAGETLRLAVACGSAKLFSMDPGALNPKLVRKLCESIQIKIL